MKSHSEQGTHAMGCQVEEEAFLISLSNWMTKAVLKNIKTNNS